MRTENFGVAVDLDSQLARWSDDQCARCVQTARCRHGLADQSRIHRDEECGCFTRSGLRLSRDIHARKGLWQRLGLDWSATLERGVGKPLLQGFR